MGGEKITINNVSGHLVLTHKATGNKEIIRINNFTKGVYFVRISDENSEDKTLKLIIK